MEKNNILSKIVILAVVLIGFVCTTPVSAQIPTPSVLNSFYYVKQITPPHDLSVPTVIEFPLAQNEAQMQMVMYEEGTGGFVKSIVRQTGTAPIVNILYKGELIDFLHDNENVTHYEFAADGTEKTDIIDYHVIEPITSSQLQIILDPYSRAPESVSIYTGGTGSQLVVADQEIINGAIFFPQTRAGEWQIHIKHKQPLRIEEIQFVPLQQSVNTTYSVRFLAQPFTSYRLYLQPNQGVIMPSVAYVDLESVSQGIRLISAGETRINSSFTAGDQDGDRVSDAYDNCPAMANADQADVDHNNIGDSCEDFDHDTVMNSVDNCPKKTNIDQTDADGDTFGDVCDPEESRLTERYWWLPWGGIFVGFAVVFFIFANTVKSAGKKDI